MLTKEDIETIRKIEAAVLGKELRPFTVAYDCGFARGVKVVMALTAEEAKRAVADECHEIIESNLLVKVEEFHPVLHRGVKAASLASATAAMIKAQDE